VPERRSDRLNELARSIAYEFNEHDWAIVAIALRAYARPGDNCAESSIERKAQDLYFRLSDRFDRLGLVMLQAMRDGETH
jgi:hypothetical protein